MATSRRRAMYLVALMLLVASCAGNEEQAVRHAVTAELIERFQVDAEGVRLLSVEGVTGAWMVRAEVSPGGRAGPRRWLTCRVERTATSGSPESRWTVTMVQDDDER